MAHWLKCPTLTTSLLRYLDQQFPDKCPRLTDDIDRIRFKSGQRAVVAHLLAKYNEQHEEDAI